MELPGFNSPPQQSTELKSEYARVLQQLKIETKIKQGAENMLNVYDTLKTKDSGTRKVVEQQLEAANKKITLLNNQSEAYRSKETATTLKKHVSPETMSRSLSTVESAPEDSPDTSPLTADVTSTVHDLLNRLTTENNEEASPTNSADRLQARMETVIALGELVKQIGHVGVHYNVEGFIKIIRNHVLTDSTKEIRANGLRILRFMITDLSILNAITVAGINVFLVRALTKDSKFDVERIQALKLIRAYVDFPGGMDYLVDGSIRAVVAVAEHGEDKFRDVCIETLCEMGIHDVQRLIHCGGIRVLLQALADGSSGLIDSIMMSLQYVLDTEDNRKFVQAGMEVEMVISTFTDAYTRGVTSDERLKSAARILTTLLKSWTGIIYFCADNKRSAKSIVDSLRLPFEETRKVLLGIFFNIFRLDLPMWTSDFASARRKSVRIDDRAPKEKDTLRFSDRLNLLDHHRTVLLILFIEVGLLETLIHLIEDDNKYTNIRATILLGEILHLSNRLLHVSHATAIQSLPGLFKHAVCFEDEVLRNTATTALSQIDNTQRGGGRSKPGNDAISNGRYTQRGQRQVQHVKRRMGIQIDDLHFKNLLAETNVLASKDFTKWEFDTIHELLQGPLLNPRRLEEVLRGADFIKRLLSFFRPSNRQFSELPLNKGNLKYMNLGCTLFTTLLANPEGVKYLGDNKLMAEIAVCLSQLDPVNPSPPTEPVFSKARIERTLTSGYFTLIGTLSKYKDGIRILEKVKIFNTLYRLSELRSRDDLIKLIITSMDYSVESHSRVILSKLLTSGYKHIRLYALNHLKTMMQSDVGQFHGWGIRLLITQLYDPAIEVCESAVSILDQACKSRQNLDALVAERPCLDHLGEAGDMLLLRFLSTSQGFQHLKDLGYVEKELTAWFESRNQQYVTRLEVCLTRALYAETPKEPLDVFTGPRKVEIDLNPPKKDDGMTPPHFYGELTKTEEGCVLLREKGHFQYFADYIRDHRMERADRTVIRKLKSILWAVGNIGASCTGLPFLLQESILDKIVDIAQNSSVFTLKGTCFYVLGLISKTVEGANLLERYGWVSAVSLDGISEGLCAPMKCNKFFTIPSWKYERARSIGDFTVTSFKARRFDALQKEILTAIGNLSNHILANDASKTLVRAKSDNPAAFQSPALYLETVRMLGAYHFRLSVRRFIMDLFDTLKFDLTTLKQMDSAMTGWTNAATFDPVVSHARNNSSAAFGSPDRKKRDETAGYQDGKEEGNAERTKSLETSSLVGKPENTPKVVIRGF